MIQTRQRLETSKTRHVVGMGEWKVSSDRGGMLVTYALGSCIGVTVWDPVARVGAMLHAMLPAVGINDTVGAPRSRYVDSGMLEMLEHLWRAGGSPQRVVIKVAGGSSYSTSGKDVFRIGARNFAALEEVLGFFGLRLSAYDLGGMCSRTMALDVGTGEVTLKIDGETTVL